jgi:hypothetical protein
MSMLSQFSCENRKSSLKKRIILKAELLTVVALYLYRSHMNEE